SGRPRCGPATRSRSATARSSSPSRSERGRSGRTARRAGPYRPPERRTPGEGWSPGVAMGSYASGRSVVGVLEPAHHRAQLRAGLLDRVLGQRLAVATEVLLAAVELLHQLVGEAAVLDLVEDAAHLLLGLGVDQPVTAGVAAVLGGVRDGPVHLRDAALVHEVDDELHLVQALEVGHLRLVAGLDQGLEARLDQLGDAAAEHRLLTEQVGLGLLLEGGLQRARPGAADRLGVRQGERPGVAGG